MITYYYYTRNAYTTFLYYSSSEVNEVGVVLHQFYKYLQLQVITKFLNHSLGFYSSINLLFNLYVLKSFY